MPLDEFQKTKHPQRVLIVDDNVDAAHILCVLLEMMGHDCRNVNDPKTAIPLADVVPPSVFILDIGMPGMDGYTLGHELKKNHPTATYIGHSAWKRNLERQNEAKFVFDYFLQKPMSVAECLNLLETIRPKQDPA